jgi:hypothetical protein
MHMHMNANEYLLCRRELKILDSKTKVQNEVSTAMVKRGSLKSDPLYVRTQAVTEVSRWAPDARGCDVMNLCVCVCDITGSYDNDIFSFVCPGHTQATLTSHPLLLYKCQQAGREPAGF